MFVLQCWFAYLLRYANSHFFTLSVSFHITFIPILNALCEARVPLNYSQRVYIQGWAESRHIMSPDVGRHKGASSVEYRAEAAIQSIKLLCGVKTQKRPKHWPGYMHRHAQAAQWHGDTDTHTPTHTLHAHLVAAQGWWKRKGIDFHWLSLWGENKMQLHVEDFRKSATPDTFCFVFFPLSLLFTNSWSINRNIIFFIAY